MEIGPVKHSLLDPLHLLLRICQVAMSVLVREKHGMLLLCKTDLPRLADGFH